MGLDFDVAFDVAFGVGMARACASTGWCYAICSSHNWLVGMLPEKAQEEYWAESPDRCRQHPLIRLVAWSTRRKGDTGFRGGGTFPAGAIRGRGSCS